MSNKSQNSPMFTWNGWIDVAILLSIGFVMVDGQYGFVINKLLLSGVRISFYPALIVSIAALLGFVLVTSAILLTINVDEHPRKLAAGKVLEKMFKTLPSAFFCLCFAFALAFLCLAVDRDSDPTRVRDTNCLLSDVFIGVCFISFAYLSKVVKLLQDLAVVQLGLARENAGNGQLSESKVPEAIQ